MYCWSLSTLYPYQWERENGRNIGLLATLCCKAFSFFWQHIFLCSGIVPGYLHYFPLKYKMQQWNETIFDNKMGISRNILNKRLVHSHFSHLFRSGICICICSSGLPLLGIVLTQRKVGTKFWAFISNKHTKEVFTHHSIIIIHMISSIITLKNMPR